MNYLELLLANAYNQHQLFQYLIETKKEMIASNYSIYRAGHFFDKAYGLYLTIPQIYELGHWINEASYMKEGNKFTDRRPDGF